MAPLLATVASGLLYPLAFPPLGLWPVAWVALAPLFVAFRRARWPAAALLGWLWTLVWCASVIDWLPSAMATYYGQPYAVGIGIFFAVSTLTGGIEYAAFGVWYRTTRWPRSALRPFVVAAAWVAAELARGTLFTGNPWALVGYSQVAVLPLLQIADVTGVYGVSFLVVAANAALAELWLARRTPDARRQAAIGSALVAASVVLALAYGTVRLERFPSEGPAVRVAAVQSDVEVITQWNPDRQDANLDVHLALTAELLRRDTPAVVFWPESAMTFFVESDVAARKRIRDLLAGSGAELVAGGPRATGGGPPYYNTAFLIAPDGRIVGAQDKRWLIPFAEYFPLGSVGLLRRRFGRIDEVSPGTRLAPLPATGGPAGVLVCHESLFPEAAAAQVHARASWLVNLSNDSWHGGAKYSLLAFDVVVLRAIEQRRWVVRASTSGPSGLVAPSGRTVARTAPFTRDTVVGTVHPRREPSPYARLGDVFAWSCAVVAVVATAITAMDRHSRRRRPRASPASASSRAASAS